MAQNVKKLLISNVIVRPVISRALSVCCPLQSKDVPEEVFPKNPLEEFHNAILQPNGLIYDKKPFRLKLEKGKKYAWCVCGRSKSQPLCDGTHRLQQLKIKLRPLWFVVDETKEYWLCNCKQTNHRPWCDGTHKREDIQAAVKF